MDGGHDLPWAVISTCMMTFYGVKVSGVMPLTYLLLTALAGPATGLLLIYQILWRPQAYARRRTNLLTCVRLLRAAVGVSAGLHFGPQLAEDWQRGPNRDALVILLPVWKSLLLLTSALGFQLSMRRTCWIQSLILAGSLANQQRCQVEQRVPAIQELYVRLRDGLAGAFAAVFPTVLASRRWGHSGCVDPCVQVQAWGQLIVGVALPCLIIDWSELQRPAPQCHPLEGYRLPQLNARSVGAMVCYLGMFMVLAALGWQAVEVALFVCQQWLGFHSLCEEVGVQLK